MSRATTTLANIILGIVSLIITGIFGAPKWGAIATGIIVYMVWMAYDGIQESIKQLKKTS